jgi:hypothetical protein
VANGGEHNILIYANLNTTPTLDSTFCTSVFDGPATRIGLYGRNRISDPIGVGADRNGNIYVAGSGMQKANVGCTPAPNQDTGQLWSFTPAHTLRWRAGPFIFMDVMDFDPTSDGTIAHSASYRFNINYDSPGRKDRHAVARTMQRSRWPHELRQIPVDRRQRRAGVHRGQQGHL